MPAKNKNTKKVAVPPKMTINEPTSVVKKAAPAAAAKKAEAAAEAKKRPIALKKRLAALFQARPREHTIGMSIPPKRDLTYFVAWPHYVRIARQKRILMKRLKSPPAIHMFDHSLDKATAVNLFKLMAKMRPEEEAARRKRRLAHAKRLAEAMKATDKDGKVDSKARAAARQQVLKEIISERPAVLRFGLNNVTNLVVKNKAQLVVIASDVDPIELVLWLPALCRKKNVPFCIVKNKARLGQLVHNKTAAAIAIADVPKELRADFTHLVDAIRPQFLENPTVFRQWGEPVMGIKHQARELKRQRRLARLEAGKKK